MILALRDGKKVEPIRKRGRKILERVHGHIDVGLQQRPLELRREHTLSADLRQGLVYSPVALGVQPRRLHLDLGPRRPNELGHSLGLRPREG